MTPQVRWELSERQRLRKEQEQEQALREGKRGLYILGGVALAAGLIWAVTAVDSDDEYASVPAAAETATRYTPATPSTSATAGAAVPPPAAAAGSAHSRTVSRGTLTPWPFTVESGLLRCRPGQQVTFETGDVEYGVNGLAQSKYPKPQPIWADDPNLGYGLKVDISTVIEAGRALC
ncbi:DUF2511 domain-containing protein [Kitasatospora sp. MBT66]|uniref:DUF2511 domain-containing protein n=1 Tax=Kitasatospora TaxID=2063 RepID=UPI001E46C16A|nr:DUF2511 domain-containing protein [Kitasatospora sp. MBT66]